MGSPFELRRRHDRLYAALMFAGACALLGLNVVHALHHADGRHCEAETSGDPFDCFICNALHHFAPAPVVVLTMPVPEAGEVMATPPEARRPAACPLHPTAARAPPTAIL